MGRVKVKVKVGVCVNEYWSNIPLVKIFPECFFVFQTSLSLLCVDQQTTTLIPYFYFYFYFLLQFKENKKKENNNSLQQSVGE